MFKKRNPVKGSIFAVAGMLTLIPFALLIGPAFNMMAVYFFEWLTFGFFLTIMTLPFVSGGLLWYGSCAYYRGGYLNGTPAARLIRFIGWLTICMDVLVVFLVGFIKEWTASGYSVEDGIGGLLPYLFLGVPQIVISIVTVKLFQLRKQLHIG